MREFIIIVIILGLIIGGNIFINNYLKRSSQSLIDDLNNLNNKLNEKAYSTDELTKEGNNIYNKWKKTGENWAFIVLHSELDLIETSLIRMKTEIEENNLDIAHEELETSIFLINHIKEKDKFCFKNIF